MIPMPFAFATISMGLPPRSQNVQRCILSIHRGDVSKTINLKAMPEHLQASNKPKRKNHMGFKCFKMFVWDHLEDLSIDRVLYVDMMLWRGNP
jgi:hypothetical protein